MKKIAKRTHKTQRHHTISLISIILILFPFTGILSVERLIYAKDKLPGIIRFILGLFVFISFFLWIADIILLILRRYRREAIL